MCLMMEEAIMKSDPDTFENIMEDSSNLRLPTPLAPKINTSTTKPQKHIQFIQFNASSRHLYRVLRKSL